MTKKRIVLLAALFLLSGCGNVGLPADASDSPGVKGESQADDDGESPRSEERRVGKECRL